MVDVAAQHLDAGHHRVHVRVLEAGHEQPAGEVDDLGRGADELAHLVVGADGHDAPAGDGDGARRGAPSCPR